MKNLFKLEGLLEAYEVLETDCKNSKNKTNDNSLKQFYNEKEVVYKAKKEAIEEAIFVIKNGFVGL